MEEYNRIIANLVYTIDTLSVQLQLQSSPSNSSSLASHPHLMENDFAATCLSSAARISDLEDKVAGLAASLGHAVESSIRIRTEAWLNQLTVLIDEKLAPCLGLSASARSRGNDSMNINQIATLNVESAALPGAASASAVVAVDHTHPNNAIDGAVAIGAAAAVSAVASASLSSAGW